MVVVLFGAFFLVSLGSLAVLGLDLVPPTPGLFFAIALLNGLLAWMIFRAYRRYHQVFRLVNDGAGELFDLSISHLIGGARGRLLRDHYRVRRAQGLVAAGDALGALAVIERLHATGRLRPDELLGTLAAEAEANLALDQPFWVDRALARAESIRGHRRHPSLRALRAHLVHRAGDPARAAIELAPLVGRLHTSLKHFPLARVTRTRNILGYGEALAAAGRGDEARHTLALAHRLAPASFYGQATARALRQLQDITPPAPKHPGPS